jgi:predicted ATP-dependent serine protease
MLTRSFPYLQGRLPRIHLSRTLVNKLSQVDCRSSRSLTSSSEVLSTLSRVLGAVGLVTGQVTAVGGDKGIDEQPNDAADPAEEQL